MQETVQARSAGGCDKSRCMARNTAALWPSGIKGCCSFPVSTALIAATACADRPFPTCGKCRTR